MATGVLWQKVFLLVGNLNKGMEIGYKVRLKELIFAIFIYNVHILFLVKMQVSEQECREHSQRLASCKQRNKESEL